MNLEFTKKMNDQLGTLSFFSHQSSLGISVIKNTNFLGGPIQGRQVNKALDMMIETIKEVAEFGAEGDA